MPVTQNVGDNMLKNYLYKWLLPKLFAKPCPPRISRSGENGKKVDCYAIYADKHSSPYFWAEKYENNVISGQLWDANSHSYTGGHSMSLSEFINYDLNITHYYGLSNISYENIYDLAWHFITRWNYIKIRFQNCVENTQQRLFNRQKLVTKTRMELLQFMMEDQLDREHKGISIMNLMYKLYSTRLSLHPYADYEQEKLKLHLESLVATGELDKTNENYVVTGKAISTIEKYIEEEDRHSEAVKLQKRMCWLTVILAIAAIVQSGMIKLPTLLDYSNNKNCQISK